MKNYIVFIITIVAFANTFAQTTIFEPQLISDEKAFGMSMSPDGEMLLYVNSFGGRDTLQIFQSKKVNGQWQKPELAFFSNISTKEIDPAFSPDGKTILYQKFVSKENRFDIFAIYKTANGWSKPEKLSDALNTESSEFFATMSLNKNIYFTRAVQNPDIYVSYFIGNKYQKAVPLENTINTDKNESNPYISSNENFIIYFSDKDGGFGDVDLYVSFKKKDKWSYPINLGNNINTELGEFCPSVDIKNKLFTFSRTKVVNGIRSENIYKIPMKDLQLKKLRKSAKWND